MPQPHSQPSRSRPSPPTPTRASNPGHPFTLHHQCVFCGRIVIEAHSATDHTRAPPTGQCLIRTGATWRHPVLGDVAHRIEGGACGYERLDEGRRVEMRPALLSWGFVLF